MIALAKQFSRFLLVGCGSAVGHYGLLYLLVRAFQVDPVIASIPAAMLGALINYALNYRFTFNSKKQHREAVIKFAFIALIGLGLNTFLMWIGVNKLGIHYMITQLIATGLVMIWSFFGNLLWTFRVHPALEQDR